MQWKEVPSLVAPEDQRETPRLLLVNHTSTMGGAEWSLLDIARGLRDSAMVYLLADGCLRAELEAEGVPVQVSASASPLARVRRHSGFVTDLSSLGAVLAAAFKLAAVARRFDVIYANSPKSLFVAAFAGLLARRPVVWHQRDILSTAHFNDWHIKLVTWICNAAVARVLANSKATARALTDAGVRSQKVRVVYNGIDGSRFCGMRAGDNHELRRELRVPEGVLLVGLFGRISPWKGQHVLIEALKRVPGISAVIVGDALFGEIDYFDELKSAANEPGVVGRVHFLGFRSDVSHLMRSVDVVVHTSVAPEAFGRVIVEAMLCERPVVATRAGGVVEIIDDGRTGLLVAPSDVNELANALVELANKPDLRTALADAGARKAKAEFTNQSMIDGVHANLLDVVESR